jgi:methionyl-tRNA synthetase
MDEIDYDLFSKIDLRVGEIISAEDVEGADKLLCLKIDIGSITKTIFAGIKKFYEPESLLGKKIIIVNNLKSRKMKFGESEGMLLAADNDEKVYLIEIDKDVTNGAKIR